MVERVENQCNKDIILAFFDILGTSKLLNEGKYQKVYDFYTAMGTFCSESRTPIAIHNPLYGKKSLFTNLSDVMADLADYNTPYHIIDYELHHAFFSDTFLIWIEMDSFLQPTLAGFLEKCCIIMCNAVQRGIPIRGVISVGSAIMDEMNHIYLGSPFAEAAKAEPQQNWVGIGLGRSIQRIHPMDMDYVLPYFNHIKNHTQATEQLLGGWVLDWPSWWRNHYKDELTKYISDMNIDKRFSVYYENCLSFIEVAKQREIIWKVYMLFRNLHTVEYYFSLGDNLDTKQLQAMNQGVELLLSSDIKVFVNNVLKMDTNLWLDKKSRDVLSDIYNEILLVNGKEYKLSSYKTIPGQSDMNLKGSYGK